MTRLRWSEVIVTGVGFINCAFLITIVWQRNQPDVGCPICHEVTDKDKQILTDPYYQTEESLSLLTINGRELVHNKTKLLGRAMEGLLGSSIAADDSRVVNVLRKYVIDLPSPYMVKMSLRLFKTPMAEAVDNLLHRKMKGFYVECGGLDGERSSNTIFFEQDRSWSGLIVEMDPSYYLQILGKNRKAYTINACISPSQYPMKMDIKEHWMGQGKLVEGEATGSTGRQAYCFPFLSMMLALNRTHIDYFSLDVEGFELDILKAIPFDRIHISILTVEQKHGNYGEKDYVDFMESQGYYKHSRIVQVKREISFNCNDLVFVKQGFLE